MNTVKDLPKLAAETYQDLGDPRKAIQCLVKENEVPPETAELLIQTLVAYTRLLAVKEAEGLPF